MSRLREILSEAQNEREARRLNELLQSDFRTDIRALLSRGTDNQIDVGNWEVRSIRKDRKPRDTSLYIHITIKYLEKTKYPGVPKRSQSKFASTDKEWVESYGDYVYYVFPDKKSSVAALEEDPTMKYFNRALSSKLRAEEMMRAGRSEFYIENWPHLYEYIVEFSETPDPNRLMSFLEDNWDKVMSEFEDFFEKYKDTDNMRVKRLAHEVRNVFWNCNEYFEDLKSSQEKPSGRDIMFDGNKYLVVDTDFFENNFTWSGTKWTLKENV